MSSLMDALGLIGDVADTPGSIARGLLAGDPARAFGGVFDPSQRVSGRGLLEQYGLVDPEAGLGGDIAGFGASLLTDPLTYIPLGWGAKAALASRTAKPAASSVLKSAKPVAVAEEITPYALKRAAEEGVSVDEFLHGVKSPAPSAKEIGRAQMESIFGVQPSKTPPVKVRNMLTGEDKFFDTWEDARAFKSTLSGTGTMDDWRVMYAPEDWQTWSDGPKPDVSGIVSEIEKQAPAAKLPEGYHIAESGNPLAKSGKTYQIIGPEGTPILNNAYFPDEAQAIMAMEGKGFGATPKIPAASQEQAMLAAIEPASSMDEAIKNIKRAGFKEPEVYKNQIWSERGDNVYTWVWNDAEKRLIPMGMETATETGWAKSALTDPAKDPESLIKQIKAAHPAATDEELAILKADSPLPDSALSPQELAVRQQRLAARQANPELLPGQYDEAKRQADAYYLDEMLEKFPTKAQPIEPRPGSIEWAADLIKKDPEKLGGTEAFNVEDLLAGKYGGKVAKDTITTETPLGNIVEHISQEGTIGKTVNYDPGSAIRTTLPNGDILVEQISPLTGKTVKTIIRGGGKRAIDLTTPEGQALLAQMKFGPNAGVTIPLSLADRIRSMRGGLGPSSLAALGGVGGSALLAALLQGEAQ